MLSPPLFPVGVESWTPASLLNVRRLFRNGFPYRCCRSTRTIFQLPRPRNQSACSVYSHSQRLPSCLASRRARRPGPLRIQILHHIIVFPGKRGTVPGSGVRLAMRAGKIGLPVSSTPASAQPASGWWLLLGWLEGNTFFLPPLSSLSSSRLSIQGPDGGWIFPIVEC